MLSCNLKKKAAEKAHVLKLQTDVLCWQSNTRKSKEQFDLTQAINYIKSNMFKELKPLS